MSTPAGLTEHVIAVRPVQGGWCVVCELVGPSTMFLSAQKAEAYGRRLAVLLGDRGYDIRLVVHDQRDAVVATAQYFGAIPALTEPSKSKPDSAWRFTVPLNAQEPA